jgi:hypothetical protein
MHRMGHVLRQPNRFVTRELPSSSICHSMMSVGSAGSCQPTQSTDNTAIAVLGTRTGPGPVQKDSATIQQLQLLQLTPLPR